MFFRLMYHVVLPLYIGFVVVASISMSKQLNSLLLIALGIMFTFSIIIEKAFSNWPLRMTIAQVLLLVCFHEVSQLNWCFTIYIILLTKVLYQQVQGTIKAVLLGFGFIFLYTIIRVSYTPFSSYSLLASGSDFLTSLAVVLIIQYIVEMERQKNALKEAMKREEMMFEHEKMRLVGELAAGLAHEIRNPLAILRGFLQHSKQRQYNIEPWYGLMIDEIIRMNKLTVEFLQFSKPDPSSYGIHSLHECLQKVVFLTGPKVADLGLELAYIVDKSDTQVRIDMSKMVQVFVNIVNNALEAEAKSGNGTVTLKLSKEESRVVVEVRDMGMGIREQDMKQIFNPFFTTKADGTGLGLSISKKIVQDHGGDIEVSSSPGRGTTFFVFLPVVSG
ncbi:two-component system sensor histidine kinase NtrB [Paenibacillus xanthanilyticus]|uniref:histidine kinase n=1 Tax=Paenibacillus xanthanilyticus TaxID=1783531 RepID=A0ABV8K7W8_9BACL